MKAGRVTRARAEQGFTLLEVLTSVLILGLAYVATLESFSVSLRNIEKAERARNAVFEEWGSFSLETRFLGTERALEKSSGESEIEEGTLFLEGTKYQLFEVHSESGDLASLVLRPIM